MSNANRPQILATVQERLDSFQLEIAGIGVPDPQTRRDNLENEFISTTQAMDEWELSCQLPRLDSLTDAVLDSIRELHNVYVHTFSDGTTKETCARCRYGRGFLTRGIAVNRQPHQFNTDAHSVQRFTKRHQCAKGKILVTVRHESKSDGPVTFTASLPSDEFSKSETAAVRKYIDARTTEEREAAVQYLASVARMRDVGKRRSSKEVLMTSLEREDEEGELLDPVWDEVNVSNDLPETVWTVLNVAEDRDRRGALEELKASKPEDHAWLLEYLKTSRTGKAHSLQERSKALTIRRWLDRRKINVA